LSLALSVTVAAFVFASCSERTAPENRAGEGQAKALQVVRVVFDLPGDDIGSPEAKALLEDVRAAILQRQAGQIVRSGFGMGEAEIVVQYQGDDAPGKIRQAIEAARPGARYRFLRDGG
jgi:hypothetical protein